MPIPGREPPDLMIKVVATNDGAAAVEALIAEGLKINITLIFSLHHYEAVAGAYIRGLHQYASPEGRVGGSVDTQVDKALDAIGSPQALALRGNIAIANAKAMYRDSMRFSVEKSSRHSDAVAHEYKGPCGPVPERKTAPTATSCMSRN